MNNAFHEIERTIQEQGAGTSEAIRALLASIHLGSCMECSTRLRSEDFVNAFRSLLKDLQLCHELTINHSPETCPAIHNRERECTPA